MEKHNKNKGLVIILLLIVALLAACNQDTPAVATPTPESSEEIVEETVSAETPVVSTNGGYPGSVAPAGAGYPVPPSEEVEGALPEPPNPEIPFPETDPDTGVVGGVLVREITDQGFLPVTHH